jgi:hypothetical protein
LRGSSVTERLRIAGNADWQEKRVPRCWPLVDGGTSRRWRYYVSQAILQGRKHEAGSVTRVPALEIERRVAETVREALSAPGGQHPSGSPPNRQKISSAPADLAAKDCGLSLLPRT